MDFGQLLPIRPAEPDGDINAALINHDADELSGAERDAISVRLAALQFAFDRLALLKRAHVGRGGLRWQGGTRQSCREYQNKGQQKAAGCRAASSTGHQTRPDRGNHGTTSAEE